MKTQDLLRASELRAEESARKAELLAREIEEGLLIFDGRDSSAGQSRGPHAAGNRCLVAAALRIWVRLGPGSAG